MTRRGAPMLPTRLTRPSIARPNTTTHNYYTNPIYIAFIVVLCAIISQHTLPLANAALPGVCPPWEYHGEHGADAWGTLCVQWVICANGKEQSPIDLTNFLRASRSLSALLVEYTTDPDPNAQIVVAHNGNALEVRWPGVGIVSHGPLEERYHLNTIHFHSPSEHTIHGKAADLEAQFIHFSDEGYMTIFAVLFQIDDKISPVLSKLYQKLPRNSTEPATSVPASTFNIQQFLDNALSDGYYYYQGSLTVPPCTQGIGWIIPRRIMSCTRDEARAFAAASGENVRPVQPLNERYILEYVPVSGLEDWIFDEQSWYIKVLVGLGMFLFLSLIVVAIYAAHGIGVFVRNRMASRGYTQIG